MLSDEQFSIWLKEGESEHLAFRLFFGHEAIETLVAFANLHGGVLLLGISELREIKGVPNAYENIDQWLHEIRIRTAPQLFPHIKTIGIEGKTIVSISIAEYPVKPVAAEGKYYKRTGKFNQELSGGEAIYFRKQFWDSNWDSNLRTDKTIADISFKKLYRLIERISLKKQCAQEEPLSFLRKYGLAEGDAITNACWLLLLPDEAAEATIELGRFSSPTVTSDTLTLKSDLFSELKEALQFVNKHIQEETQTGESARWQYPPKAIRELIVNMIIHRDYTSDYNSIVKIFDGYIEFYNPGSLPEELSFKQLLTDTYISRPRNPQIAELFKDAGMFEEYGSGIQNIHSAFADRGLRLPEFIKLPGRLIVRVFGEISENYIKEANEEAAKEISKEIPQKITEKATEQFSEREQQIMTLILKDNRIPLNEIAQKLTVSKRTILRDIKKMKAEKIIERIGNEKNGYWEVISAST